MTTSPAMTHDEYFSAERIDLREIQFTPELLRCIPANVARRYRVLPVFDDAPQSLSIALGDPSDLDAIDGVSSTVRRDLVLCVADSQQLDEFIHRLYGGHDK
jgi:type IV pilus assembly protein PilB